MENQDQDKTISNEKKQRTHIPVEGYTIEDLRKMTTDELIEIAKKLGALDDDDWDMWEKKVQEYKENR